MPDQAKAPTLYLPCRCCGSERLRPERIVKGSALVRCRDCGLVFANPQLSPDALADIYRERSNVDHLIDYYASVHDAAKLAEYDRHLVELEHLRGGPGRLLDFGCGAGYCVERAAGRGWDAHGVELGAWAGEAARRRGVRQVHIGALQDAGFADASFDVIYSSQVFEHLQSPLETLEPLFRLLKPGGLLHLNVPNYRRLAIMLGREDWYMNHPPQHINYFTPKTLGALCRRVGFDVARVYSEGGLELDVVLGRRVTDRPPAAPRSQPEPGRPAGGVSGGDRSAKARVKGLLMPLVKAVLYERAVLGVVLVVIARKP